MTGPAPEPVSIPEWVATLVGSLLLQGEAARRQLAELQAERAAAPPESA